MVIGTHGLSSSVDSAQNEAKWQSQANHFIRGFQVGERDMVPETVSGSHDMDNRLRAVERLTELYKPERLVYLGFAVIAFLMLIVCLISALVSKGTSASLFAAFGSSGIVAYTSSRVIVMWNRALEVVTQASVQGGGHGKQH